MTETRRPSRMFIPTPSTVLILARLPADPLLADADACHLGVLHSQGNDSGGLFGWSV